MADVSSNHVPPGFENELNNIAIDFDGVIHNWLCKGWIIKLIVAPAPVAHVIYHHIFAEFLTIFDSQSTGPQNLLKE